MERPEERPPGLVRLALLVRQRAPVRQALEAPRVAGPQLAGPQLAGRRRQEQPEPRRVVRGRELARRLVAEPPRPLRRPPEPQLVGPPSAEVLVRRWLAAPAALPLVEPRLAEWVEAPVAEPNLQLRSEGLS